VAKEPEPRSAVALGFEWASKVSTVAVGFSLPAIIGFGIDRWSGSSPVATLAGVAVGFVSGLIQIMRLAQNLPGQGPLRASRSNEGVAQQDLDRPKGNRPGPPPSGA
jgi:F0F1-type ATP synthase assembly protein I